MPDTGYRYVLGFPEPRTSRGVDMIRLVSVSGRVLPPGAVPRLVRREAASKSWSVSSLEFGRTGGPTVRLLGPHSNTDSEEQAI
jgi:hypothetical protein